MLWVGDEGKGGSPAEAKGVGAGQGEGFGWWVGHLLAALLVVPRVRLGGFGLVVACASVAGDDRPVICSGHMCKGVARRGRGG